MEGNGTPADRRFSDLFSRSDYKIMPSLRQVNDSVYEFYSPPDGVKVSLEIIFFHGVERGDYSKAYVESWTSFLESTGVCWPQTLLAEQFSTARILSVSYDSSIKKGPLQGNLDLYLTAENLVQDLIDDAKVAANPGLPVVLVGKDFGGLVIKAVCIKAKDQNRFTFLSNLKAIFYYGTPHLGVENLPTAFNGALAERLMFGNKEIARLGSDFSNYRKERKWATRAILSLHTSEKVPGLVISEASQRYDVDNYYTAKGGTDTICKSQARTSSSFKFLTDLISCIESSKLMVERSPDQWLIEGVRFKTSLGFTHDGNYVPMEKTLAEVKNALQGARIVVLHGAPGSGKSSLARYLALQFEAVTLQQGTGMTASSSAEQSDWLPHGVVYITCGNGAEIISVQRELLRKVGIEVPLLKDISTASDGPAELRRMLRQELVDLFSKSQSRVLVVFDDVWESPDLLDNLLVPGDRVKYVITTQISTLWNAHDSKRIQMQDVTLEDARHILGNYANFAGGVISKDLENLGDEIIATTRSHPLALATLGNVLNNMTRTMRDWQEVKGNLTEHLETKDYPPSSFGQKYPLSVNASMMVGLDLLDEDAKKLLYKITLFDGPFIPETLLQLFLACTLPSGKKINISKSKMSLVAKGLVRIETETLEERVTNPTSSSVGDDTRVIWIHGLLQHFILTTKTEEIRQIISFLDKDCDHKFLHLEERFNLDLAIALCALYGTSDINRKAMLTIGSSFIERRCRLASALKPLISLMFSEGDTKGPMSQAAVEVFLKYVWKRELDDDKISFMLKETAYPSAPLATLRALADIFELEYYAIEDVKLIDEAHFSFFSVILSLVKSRDDANGRSQEKSPSLLQMCACRALRYICLKATREKSTTVVLNVPHILNVLVDLIEAALQDETAELSNQLAALGAMTLVSLSYGDSKEARLKICNTEGLLACLVRSLSAHYNHPLQKWAATALGNLGLGYADTKWIICNADGALAGLVQSLSAQNNRALQEHAARALQILTNSAVDTRLKICNTEGALAGLIKSLSSHGNLLLQEYAAKALQNVASGDVDVNINLKICNEEGALSGLVRSLSEHDNPPLQESAARTLQSLSRDLASASKVWDEPGSPSAIVQSLSAKKNPSLQIATAFILANLAYLGGDIILKICHEEGALSGLVKLLFQDENTDVQQAAAWALMNLTFQDGTVQLKVANEKGAIEGLLRAMSPHDKPVLQEKAMRVLNSLAMVAGESIKLKITEEDGAVACLMKLSKHKNTELQQAATCLVMTLGLEGSKRHWMQRFFVS